MSLPQYSSYKNWPNDETRNSISYVHVLELLVTFSQFRLFFYMILCVILADFEITTNDLMAISYNQTDFNTGGIQLSQGSE